MSAGVSKAATPGIMDTFNHPASQGIAVAIVGGTVSEVTGGKFANGAVTAAMAFAFNELSSREGRQVRGDASGEELPATVCSPDGSCIGYFWKLDAEPTTTEPLGSKWLGTDQILPWEWNSIIPEYIGRNLFMELLTTAVDRQWAMEPGRVTYPYLEFREVYQWHEDASGNWTERLVRRYGRIYTGNVIYRTRPEDQAYIYRRRTRVCILGDCKVLPDD